MGRILDLFGEVAAEADEGAEGLELSPEAWDRLRGEWKDEDIEDALGLVHESLLQSELVEAAESLNLRLLEILGEYGNPAPFAEVTAGRAVLTVDVLAQIVRRVDRLDEVLGAFRDGRRPRPHEVRRAAEPPAERRDREGDVVRRRRGRPGRVSPAAPVRALRTRARRGGPAQPDLAAGHGDVARHRGRLRHRRPCARSTGATREGGAGMIVLEATGVRDVASGPLLRLSHDRFVPGLRALRDEMRALSARPRRPADHRLPEDRAPQADARVHGGPGRARNDCPESALALSDEAFERDAPSLLSPRQLRDLRFGYRQTIEDLSADEIARIPGFFADAAARARAAGFDGVELHFAHAYTMASFLSVTNARHGRVRRQLREPDAPAARGGARGARRRRRRLRGRLPLPRVRGHPRRGRRPPRQHARGRLRDRRRAGAGRSRLPVGLARRQVRGRAAAARRRGRLPVHRPQRPHLHPARQARSVRRERAAGRRHPRGRARRRLHDARSWPAGRSWASSRRRRSSRAATPTSSAWRARCSPTRTCRASGAPARSRRCGRACSARSASRRTSTTGWSRARCGRRARADRGRG